MGTGGSAAQPHVPAGLPGAWSDGGALRGFGFAFFGALFGIARGLAVAFVVVLIGGLAGVSKEPWWRDALFSAPLESAVIAAKPWLPAEVADKIRFR